MNDALDWLGANRDRHANIGQGVLGKKLAVFLGHPSFENLPAVAETAGPDGHGPDAAEMKRFKKLAAAGVAAR